MGAGMKTSLLLCVGLLLAGVAPAADSQAALQDRLRKTEEPRILFVGNSYSFKLPGALARLVRNARRKVVVEGVSRGGWTLEKHAASKETLARIREGKWDVVVLQEQSQLPAFNRDRRSRQMIPHAKTLVTEIRKAGAVPVFFQTWGRRDGDHKNAEAFPKDTFEKMQHRLVIGYREAAVATEGALVVPVGEAWAREMKEGTGKRLFARDGSHPSAGGVNFSAEVFRNFFFGK
tara:strand:- start:1214 stop:1912 length:699 start_codon:yes stop_codon:yes gene_type:complete